MLLQVVLAALVGVASCAAPAPYGAPGYADPYPAIAPNYNVRLL